MKINKSIVLSFVLLVIVASLYRIMPNRPWGFAPQIAMALFSGSIVKDKKYAFLLPIASMFLSDVIYELLFRAGLTSIYGFYEGQVLNYLLFAAVAIVGFFVNRKNVFQIAAGSLAAAVFYFVISNFGVWIGGGLAMNNLPYPKTWAGLAECYTAALPFFRVSIYATLFFSALLFGGYALFTRSAESQQAVALTD